MRPGTRGGRGVRGPGSPRRCGGGGRGRALAALPADCRIVAIGPLTNVAAAIAVSPALPGRVSLSVVGGNLTSRGPLPPVWPHEFNFAKDRAAARAVLGAKWRRLVLYPLDAMRRMRCTEDRLRRISALGAAGALLASALETMDREIPVAVGKLRIPSLGPSLRPGGGRRASTSRSPRPIS